MPLRLVLSFASVGGCLLIACSSSPPAVEKDGTESSALTGTAIPGLYPTGVGADGTTLLTVGAVDSHYTVTATTDVAVTPLPAKVYAVTPNGAWAPNAATGEWVSVYANTNGTVATYTYTTTFTVSALASTASLSGTWACDNNCSAYLNGVLFATGQTYTPAGTFTAPNTTYPLATFVSGTNTLSFVVNNTAGGFPNPTGLAVLSLTGTEGCYQDTNCTTAQYCNTVTSVCTAKVANSGNIPVVVGHSPTLDGTCTAANAATVGPDACASGVCDPADLLNECGYANGDGSCTPATSGVAVCRSGVCDTDRKCGFATGDGPCTTANPTVCRSGFCSANGTCKPSRTSCYVDGDCTTATQYCDTPTSTCTAKVANGGGIPSVTGHSPTLDGTCTTANAALVGPDVCASGVCDTNDGDCGFANSDGTCSPGATGVAVCRSGACDTDDVCGFANGHGTCLPGTSATNCRSGVCDTDGVCGLKNGDGTCTPAATGSTVCRSGSCSANGMCKDLGACSVDGDCSTAQYCDTPSATCVLKIANGSSVPSVTGHSPTLDGTCTAANAATVGPDVCASGACDPSDAKCGYANGDGVCTPVTSGSSVCRSGACDTDTKCGFADGDGTCTPATAAVVCRSGGCSTTGVCEGAGRCVVDADCTGGKWCNEATSTCTAPLANGAALPSDPSHTAPALNGACTAAAGKLVCASGVCDAKNSECGYANGDGPCTTATGSTVCQSGMCSATGVCEPANGCLSDADCTMAQWCNETTSSCVAKVANGGALPTDPAHADPALNGTCTAAAGAAVCQSGACDTKTNTCGIAAGDGTCTNDGQCIASTCNSASGICSVGGNGADGGVVSNADGGLGSVVAGNTDGLEVRGGGCSVDGANGSGNANGLVEFGSLLAVLGFSGSRRRKARHESRREGKRRAD